MRFLSFWLFIIFILSVMGIGRMFYQQDNTLDINNITNKFVWNESLYEDEIQNTTNEMNFTERGIIHLKNIIYKGISNIGFIAFEIARFGIELGYTEPDYNYLWFAKWIIYMIILCIILTLLPTIPILLALIYLTYILIKKITILIKIKLKKNRK